MFGSDISARVEAMVTIAPRALRNGFSAARAKQERRGQIGVDDAMPFGERQPAQRLADHDAGIGDHRIEPAETVRRAAATARGSGFLVADIAFDQNDVARARRKGAVQPAAGQVDDADAPAGGEQMARNGAADAVGAAGHQRDGFRCRHVGGIRRR